MMETKTASALRKSLSADGYDAQRQLKQTTSGSESLGVVPDVVVDMEEGDETPEADKASAKDRWRNLSLGQISFQDDNISQVSISTTTSACLERSQSRAAPCRRTLRGLQRSFPAASKPEEAVTRFDQPHVGASQSVADLVQSGMVPVVTVESKITTAQLERVRSKRKTNQSSQSKFYESSAQKNKSNRIVSMPSNGDIDRRFSAILEALDMPEESLAQLQTCSLEKKWQMICDHSHKEEDSTFTPRFFTEKLWAVIADKNFKDTSQLVKRMEVILRSTQINWLNVFLSPAVNGLNAIISLVENMQMAIKTERSKLKNSADVKSTLATQEATAKIEKSRSRNSMRAGNSMRPGTARKSASASVSPMPTQGPQPQQRGKTLRILGRGKKNSITKAVSLLNLPFEYHTLAHDIILVLRAMMNTEIGFMAVAEHKTALNVIAGCLWDTLPKTQIVVLEVLTAISMVDMFHSRVVEAMDYNRKSFGEDSRFQHLVQAVKDPPDSMANAYVIAVLNFFNVVVHAAPNVNFRVHLQYDLTALGFDECLGDLLQRNDVELMVQKQINAYVDNFFDVQSLLENLDNPSYGKFSKNAEMQVENERLKEELNNTETRYVAKIAELEDSLRDMRRTIELLTETEKVSSRRASMTQSTGPESAQGALLSPTSSPMPLSAEGTKPAAAGQSATGADGESSPTSSPAVSETPPPVTPAPSIPQTSITSGAADVAALHSAAPPPETPPPPPPPDMGVVPPPPPGMFGKPHPQAKKVIKTKYKMPALNWQVIRTATWASTIFGGLDSDFYQKMDRERFEETFKLKHQPTDEAGVKTKKFVIQNVKTAKILDGNICRNIGIIQRKLGMNGRELAEQINKYSVIPDHADLLGQLLKITPTDSELQKLERHDKNNTSKTLADEELFMVELYRIPRYPAKLRVLVYMLNFKETVDFIQPQLQSVYVACSSLLSSSSLRKMYELLLTIGNVANSARRGWTTGFQVASLDVLKSMKSTDGNMNLMNYLAEFISDKKEYNNIYNELIGLDRACSVVLSQMSSEISQLVSGLLLLRAEDKKDSSHSKELSEFLANAKQVVPDIERLYSRAQESFGEVIVYLGETPKNQNPSDILGPVSRFVRNLSGAKKENEMTNEKAIEAKRKKEMDRAHKETAAKLNDVLKSGNPFANPGKGNPLSRMANGNNRHSTSFIDDMLNASKTVAYRAEVKAGR